MPNGSCFCPAVCHLAKTFGQHLRRSRKKTFAASVRSAHTNQRGTVAGEGSGSGVRHVEHACTTDTRAHVPHLFDGNLHALDSHQRQTVSALDPPPSSRPPLASGTATQPASRFSKPLNDTSATSEWPLRPLIPSSCSVGTTTTSTSSSVFACECH